MRYRLDFCPVCQLRPVDEYDLPAVFPPEARLPVVCTHCGTRLTAMVVGEATGGLRQVVFRPTRGDEPGSRTKSPGA